MPGPGSLAPTWFDPAETSGITTPILLLYALHDARVEEPTIGLIAGHAFSAPFEDVKLKSR